MREGVIVTMGWPFKNVSATRPRADRDAAEAPATTVRDRLTTGQRSSVRNRVFDPLPLDLNRFNERYEDIKVLRNVANGTLTSVEEHQLSRVLAPLAKSLTKEPYITEVKRWNEVFADVFVGLDSFKLQLDQGVPFAPSDLDLSEDSARIAIEALVRRLLRKKVAA